VVSRLASIFAVALVACVSGTRPPTPVAATPADAGADEEEEDAGAVAEEDASVPEVADEPAGPCPSEMVLIEGEGVRVCVDRWEASLVEVDGDGNEKPYPHWLPVDGHTVRAVSQPDVFPQGYISEVQAEDACAASKKRLCLENEWMTACTGPEKTTYPYGDARKPTACHDSGKSAVGAVFGMQALASSPPPPVGKPAHVTTKKAAVTTKTKPSKKGSASASTKKTTKKPTTKGKPAAAKASKKPAEVSDSVWTKLNDPRLGQVDGALAKTGTHEDCTNSYGALDMMGNLHEWVRTPASLPHGTFCGGYYLDTTLNGDGCKYRTKAHAHDYHDYSTGFRCCADPR
jgi:formylglycine-generating enzyme required for sulfatase activity